MLKLFKGKTSILVGIFALLIICQHQANCSCEFHGKLSSTKIYGFMDNQDRIVLFFSGKEYFKCKNVTQGILFVTSGHSGDRTYLDFPMRTEAASRAETIDIGGSSYFAIRIDRPVDNQKWKKCSIDHAAIRGRLLRNGSVCGPEDCPNMSTDENCPIVVTGSNCRMNLPGLGCQVPKDLMRIVKTQFVDLHPISGALLHSEIYPLIAALIVAAVPLCGLLAIILHRRCKKNDANGSCARATDNPNATGHNGFTHLNGVSIVENHCSLTEHCFGQHVMHTTESRIPFMDSDCED